jgi:hypothetical protein
MFNRKDNNITNLSLVIQICAFAISMISALALVLYSLQVLMLFPILKILPVRIAISLLFSWSCYCTFYQKNRYMAAWLHNLCQNHSKPSALMATMIALWIPTLIFPFGSFIFNLSLGLTFAIFITYAYREKTSTNSDNTTILKLKWLLGLLSINIAFAYSTELKETIHLAWHTIFHSSIPSVMIVSFFVCLSFSFFSLSYANSITTLIPPKKKNTCDHDHNTLLLKVHNLWEAMVAQPAGPLMIVINYIMDFLKDFPRATSAHTAISKSTFIRLAIESFILCIGLFLIPITLTSIMVIFLAMLAVQFVNKSKPSSSNDAHAHTLPPITLISFFCMCCEFSSGIIWAAVNTEAITKFFTAHHIAMQSSMLYIIFLVGFISTLLIEGSVFSEAVEGCMTPNPKKDDTPNPKKDDIFRHCLNPITAINHLPEEAAEPSAKHGAGLLTDFLQETVIPKLSSAQGIRLCCGVLPFLLGFPLLISIVILSIAVVTPELRKRAAVTPAITVIKNPISQLCPTSQDTRGRGTARPQSNTTGRKITIQG